MVLCVLFFTCTRKADETKLSRAAETSMHPPAGTVPQTATVQQAVEMQSVQTQASDEAQRESAAQSISTYGKFIALDLFKTVYAQDFTLGKLYEGDAAVMETLEHLASGLKAGALPENIFYADTYSLARIMYTDEVLASIRGVRFGAADAKTPSVAGIPFKVFAAQNDNQSYADMHSACGLIILQKDENNPWRVVHFELDADALKILPKQQTEPWDPYKALSE